VTCGDESISRVELERRSNRLARAYAELGVTEGRYVTVALANSVEFFVACAAIWKLGATPQPVSYRLPDRECQAIVELAQQIPAWVIQLHNDLPVEALQALRCSLAPRKLLGKVSVEGPAALLRAREISGCIDALLLDSCDRTSNRMGGTGLVHDWNLSAQIVRESPVPVILAGGLTSANVAKAIDLVHPWGVDVNTGVKADAGGKSAERCRQFVSASKAESGGG
jgi:phosphoribosylanthranilate isomerase